MNGTLIQRAIGDEGNGGSGGVFRPKTSTIIQRPADAQAPEKAGGLDSSGGSTIIQRGQLGVKPKPAERQLLPEVSTELSAADQVRLLAPIIRERGTRGYNAIKRIASLGAEATKPVVDAFSFEENPMAKADLLWSLALIQNAREPGSPPLLSDHQKNVITKHASEEQGDDPLVKEFSAWILHFLYEPRRGVYALSLYHSPPKIDNENDVFQPLFAALELDMLGTKDTIPPLLILAEARGRYGMFVRAAAAAGIRKFKNVPAVDRMLKSLMVLDNDPQVRALAGGVIQV